ncbi:MAG: hypothetical protein WCT85_05440 [Parachlamydiales bacterium]
MSGLLCVEESEKTKKARDKLKKILEKLEKEITQDGLNKKIFEIHDRISRLAPERVVLKRKSISLFDNNQNAAKVSEKVASIFQALRLNKISPGSADDDI